MAMSVEFQSFLDELIDKNDIVEVVSMYAKLKRSGRTYRGLCPIHNDRKNPSLSVDPQNRLFKCFGCGAGGTVIQLKRNSKDDCSAPTQFLINNTKDLKSVFVSPSVEEVPTSHFTNAPQIIGINKYMKQFLDDYDFEYTDADIAQDKDVLEEYRNAMKEYKKTSGSVFANKIKHALIKYTACLIPGRERR